MAIPHNYKAVLDLFDKQPDEIKWHFENFADLISRTLPYDVAIAYLFSRVEYAHRSTLYCGITKRYATDAILTQEIITSQHFTRKGFRTAFQAVFGETIQAPLLQLIKSAEKVRDTGMHGVVTTEKDGRQAIHDIFQYATGFNNFVEGVARFRPFGKLKGFKGRKQSIDNASSRLILKGLGFSVR